MSEPSGKAISHLLNRSAKNPFEVFSRLEVARSISFLRQFLEQCDVINFERPHQALDRALVARELAHQMGNQHTMVKALALLGTAFRLESCLEKAEKVYEEAEGMAGECSCCLPDLFLRYGVLNYFQNNLQKSLDYFRKAIQIYEGRMDLDGVGRSLVMRCMSLSELGRHKEALEDNARGLQLLAKDTPQSFFVSGLSNMILITTSAVRATDDTKMIEKALRAIQQYRDHLQKQRIKYGFRRVRALMRWAEGLLCGSLPSHGYKYRRRAMQALEIAANNFKDMGLMTEYVLVTADLAKLYLTNTRIDNSRSVMTLASRCLRVLEEAGQGGSHNAIVAKAVEVMKDLQRNPERELLDGLRESANFYMPSVDPELISVSDAGAVG